jgi:MYXO-CTERM domain-containing protein
MRKFASLMLGCAAFFGANEARAEVGVDNFDPQTSFRPQEFPWESGWLPEDSALQINLQAAAYQEVEIRMTGDGAYDFDAQTLTFTGEQDAGVFQNALGIEITAVVGIHGILGIDTEFEVGLYTIEETSIGQFTPYVLPGAPERPIVVAEAFGPNNLVDEDFTIPGFGIPGNLNIDFTLNIPGNEYSSLYIDLNDSDNTSAAPVLVGQYDQENENLDLILPNATPGEDSELYATLHGTFSSEISIVFEVTVTIEISDIPFEIGPFPIVLDYPVVQDLPIVFGEEQLLYSVPEMPEPPGTTDDGGVDESSSGAEETGDSDSDSDSTTSGDPPGETGDAPPESDTEGGIPADNVPATSPGCGCASGRTSLGTWAIMLFGLAAVRRRRA